MSTPSKRTKEADISALPTPSRDDLAATVADLGLEVETLKSKLKEANGKRDEHAKALEELQTHAAAQAVKLDEQKNELLTAKEDLEYAQRQTAALQTEVAKLTAELTEAKRDKALIMAELGDVARQRDAARVESENARAALDEWEKHPFFGVVDQLNRQCGEISADLVEQTDKVISAANDTGKPGKVTLTLAIKPSDEHARGMIAAAKVTSTLPKADPAKAVFFMDNGKVTADDPAQRKLPMQVPQGRRPAPTADERELERKLANAKPAQVVPAECPEVPSDLTDDYDAVLRMAMEGEKLTVQAIQRRLGIGYTRALALLDLYQKRTAWQSANS
ncbi:MAG: hypothetical protein NTU84_00565 [Verrucomicrobia bacterium]|nr:hypothetical protein [Verrucomicrobiota bacterium]